MNTLHDSAHTPLSREPHRGANTRIPERWLVLARLAWIAIVVPALGLFVASAPGSLVFLRTASMTPPRLYRATQPQRGTPTSGVGPLPRLLCCIDGVIEYPLATRLHCDGCAHLLAQV